MFYETSFLEPYIQPTNFKFFLEKSTLQQKQLFKNNNKINLVTIKLKMIKLQNAILST